MLALGAQAQAQEFRVGFVNTDRIFREANTRQGGPGQAGAGILQAREGARGPGQHAEERWLTSLSARPPRCRRASARSARSSWSTRTGNSSASAANSRKTSTRARTKSCSRCSSAPTSVVKQVAEAEKYDVILQEAVYVNPKHDITDKVIKALNAGSAKWAGSCTARECAACV